MLFKNEVREYVKVLVLLILFVIYNNTVVAVTKRQITVGQYFFPRTASFPDYGYNADAHSLSEPIYDEIILLPNEKQHEQHHSQHSQQQLQRQQQHQQQQQQQQQGVVEQKRARVYPVPARIFQKNRFGPLGIRPGEGPLLFNKKMVTNVPADGPNATTYVAVPQDGVMTDVHIQMNVDDSDDIHAMLINNAPGIVSGDQQHPYGGYAGRVVIDLTNDDSSETTKTRSRMSHRLQKSAKFPAGNRISEDNAFLASQKRARNFRSNTEIFNQILKVRKDIDSLRRDIRRVKEMIQQIGATGLARQDKTLASHGTHRGAKMVLDGSGTEAETRLPCSADPRPRQRGAAELQSFLQDHGTKDTEIRPRQVFPDYTPKYGTDNVTAKPAYIFISRTASAVDPTIRSRLRANAKAPALVEEQLATNVAKKSNNSEKSTKLSPKAATEQDLLSQDSIIRIDHKKQPLKILPVKAGSGNNPVTGNSSNDLVKLSSAVRITNNHGGPSKFLQNQAVLDYTDKIAASEEKKQWKTVQRQVPTTAKPDFFATAPSLSSENEVPGMSVTQAFQTFSSTRYTARSRINYGRQMRKLIVFTTTPTPRALHSSTIPFIQFHDNAQTQSTGPSVVPIVPSKSVFSEVDAPGDMDPFNSTLVILGFASLTSPKAPRDRALKTVSPTVSSRKTVITPATTIGTRTRTTTTTTTATSTTTTSTTTTPTTSRPTTTTADIAAENFATESTIEVPLIPANLNFLSNNFDGPFMPWFNDPQLWPEGLFQRG